MKKFPDHGFDGMRCDVDGNLYITRYGKGTVAVLSPEGQGAARDRRAGPLAQQPLLRRPRRPDGLRHRGRGHAAGAVPRGPARPGLATPPAQVKGNPPGKSPGRRATVTPRQSAASLAGRLDVAGTRRPGRGSSTPTTRSSRRHAPVTSSDYPSPRGSLAMKSFVADPGHQRALQMPSTSDLHGRSTTSRRRPPGEGSRRHGGLRPGSARTECGRGRRGGPLPAHRLLEAVPATRRGTDRRAGRRGRVGRH